jgi:hypothetical protein
VVRERSLVSASVALTITAPTASAAAIVYHANGSFECGADPGDIPGLPGFDLANTTVVIDSTGALHVTCYGSLPAGLSVPQTFVGSAVCRGDSGYADTPGLGHRDTGWPSVHHVHIRCSMIH